MFARFDENPAMTLRVIKETKRYGRTDARTDGRTDGRTDNVKTVYPLQTKFAGGIKITFQLLFLLLFFSFGWCYADMMQPMFHFHWDFEQICPLQYYLMDNQLKNL